MRLEAFCIRRFSNVLLFFIIIIIIIIIVATVWHHLDLHVCVQTGSVCSMFITFTDRPNLLPEFNWLGLRYRCQQANKLHQIHFTIFQDEFARSEN